MQEVDKCQSCDSAMQRAAGTAGEGFFREVQVTGELLGLRSAVCMWVTAERKTLQNGSSSGL